MMLMLYISYNRNVLREDSYVCTQIFLNCGDCNKVPQSKYAPALTLTHIFSPKRGSKYHFSRIGYEKGYKIRDKYIFIRK